MMSKRYSCEPVRGSRPILSNLQSVGARFCYMSPVMWTAPHYFGWFHPGLDWLWRFFVLPSLTTTFFLALGLNRVGAWDLATIAILSSFNVSNNTTQHRGIYGSGRAVCSKTVQNKYDNQIAGGGGDGVDASRSVRATLYIIVHVRTDISTKLRKS